MTTDRVLLTLVEAVAWLDPPMPLRTLRDHVHNARIPVHGTRPATGRGRRAHLYDATDLARVHAAWVRRTVPPTT